MTLYEYRVLYREAGSPAWIEHPGQEPSENPGGRHVVTGLDNAKSYEFMVVRDAPSPRESQVVAASPVPDIDAPPNTFVPTGDQVVDPSGSAAGQRGSLNNVEGVLLSFTGGANWNSFDVVIIDADGREQLLCTVQKAPKRVVIGGETLEFNRQTLVIELISNKQFFVKTGGGADVSVRPNGNSFAAFTLEID